MDRVPASMQRILDTACMLNGSTITIIGINTSLSRDSQSSAGTSFGATCGLGGSTGRVPAKGTKFGVHLRKLRSTLVMLSYAQNVIVKIRYVTFSLGTPSCNVTKENTKRGERSSSRGSSISKSTRDNGTLRVRVARNSTVLR